MIAQAYHKEIRIALVLYGGVALATYINGACRELFHLVKAARGEESPYKAIVDDLQANIVIDIISGTSAGGLNGPALAKALVFGTDFVQLESFWIDEGQIEDLLNSPKRSPMESLLNEESYKVKLENAFEKLHASSTEGSLVESMDLFINTTDLHGRGVAFPSFNDDPIYTKTHERTFHLRYRPGGINCLMDNTSPRLWEMCRATSAFPIAFPPARVKDKKDGVRYLSDGGLTNNFPFEQAVDAIATRPADVYVDRVLFYVEPDPGFGRAAYERLRGDQTALDPDDVLVQALFVIPGFESITADLKRLQEHNVEVEAHNTAAKAIEEWFEREYRGYVIDGRRLDPDRYREFRESPLFRAYQAMKRVDIHRTVVRWLLDAHPQVDIRELGAALRRMETDDLENFYKGFDAAFKVRRFYHLTRELIRVIREVASESLPGSEVSFARFPSIVPEGTLLRELLTEKAKLLELASKAREIPGEVREALSGLPVRDEATLTEYLNRARLAQEERLQELTREGVAAVQEIDAVLRRHGREASANFEIVSDSFELRDAFLFPSTFGRGPGERDYVDLVPITPAEPSYTGIPQKSKLAGESFFHFGGFLSKEWRRNDIMWGRLDAAESIVCFLRTRIPEERKRPFEEYVRPIQEGIVRTYTSFDSRPNKSQDYRDYLKRSNHVGDQRVTDLPPAQMVPLALKVLGVVQGMMEHLQRKKATTPVRGAAYGALARGLGYLGSVLSPVASLLFPGSSWAKRAMALPVVLAIGWALGTFALEVSGLQELRRSTLVLAGLTGLIAVTVGGFYYKLTWWRFLRLSVLLAVLVAAAFLDVRYPGWID